MVEFQKVGYTPGEHANSQARVPDPECHWLDWDGYYEAEERQQRMDRFCPHDASVPLDLYFPNGTPRIFEPDLW